MNSIAIYNTNNACATGSTGLHMARTMVRSGAADCVLVIRFEQMQAGSIKFTWNDRPSPIGLSTALIESNSREAEGTAECTVLWQCWTRVHGEVCIKHSVAQL